MKNNDNNTRAEEFWLPIFAFLIFFLSFTQWLNLYFSNESKKTENPSNTVCLHTNRHVTPQKKKKNPLCELMRSEM